MPLLRLNAVRPDEEDYMDEEYASDSSEVPLTDELSGKEIIYIYWRKGLVYCYK